MDWQDILPYTCIYLDACWSDFFKAAAHCAVPTSCRRDLIHKLQQLWTNTNNPNAVLPCLSVRTAFDMYLRIKNFPPGSEIICSAINIPDMIRVIHHHKLRVVSMDVNLDTMAPKIELLPSLITDKTVAVLLAHVYAKWFDVQPFIEIAQKHNIAVIEDCAEVFCGFEHLGNPQSDLSLFSFGAIKYYTSFGGAIAKIKDEQLYNSMVELYKTYPVQSHAQYLSKVLKYSMAFTMLNVQGVIKSMIYFSSMFGFDEPIRKSILGMLRGFPNNMMDKIRQQPSGALLQMMLHRQSNFDVTDFNMARLKGDYVSERLPDKVTQVGTKAFIRNYWLFPIIVDNPDEVAKTLNAIGVEAYRGATQLNIVEPDNGDKHTKHLHTFVTRYPHEAKYLINHVVYIPVNKSMPFYELDKLCRAVEIAIKSCNGSRLIPLQPGKVKIQSKL